MMKVWEMITKISKYIFENIESFVIITALVVAGIIFFHKQAQIEPQVLQLRQDFNAFVHQSTLKHQELTLSQQESKHSLELSLAKLEASLAQITTDIQFIKQRIVFGEKK